MYSKLLFALFFTLINGLTVAPDYDLLLFTEDFFPLINSRLDPIVTPGKVSGHVHHVVGGSKFSAKQDYASCQSSKCTTANLPPDKSNYWTPQLYYKWRNGSYTAITGDGMTNYWRYPMNNTNSEAEPFAAIPDDFQMLAGDIKRDDVDPHNAVEFLCIDAHNSYDYTGYLPTDRECLTLRPQLHFPECWNGVDSYKPDNSHVAYPVDGNPEGGVCPQGFKKIPHLFLESTYHIRTENIGEGYEWYPGCFVFANGDNHGFSFHADWLNGFPTNYLTDAFQQCFNKGTGKLDKPCNFVEQGKTDIDVNCVTEGDVINELVGQHFAIPSLPGNNPEFNSSKYSNNYPKGNISGYEEKHSIIKANQQTGGFCFQGICTDYIGSDLVQAGNTGPVVPGQTASNGTSNSTNPPGSNGPPNHSSITNSVPQQGPPTDLPVSNPSNTLANPQGSGNPPTGSPNANPANPVPNGQDATISIQTVPNPVDTVSPIAVVQPSVTVPTNYAPKGTNQCARSTATTSPGVVQPANPAEPVSSNDPNAPYGDYRYPSRRRHRRAMSPGRW